MTVFSSTSYSRFFRSNLLRVALLCALGLPSALRAADDPPRELEEKTSSDLEKLKPLLDAKNWDGAIALLSTIGARVSPESYDMAIVTDVEAKIYLQKGEYAKAIKPWEAALRLGDAHRFFDKNSIQEMVYFLAQIYYQEATSSKDPAVQKQNFAKSIAYLQRWMRDTTKPPYDQSRQDAILFYANVLYNQAVSGNPDHPDPELMKQAEAEIQKGLRLNVRPKESFYLILLAISQQQGNYERLADILELLVKQYPAKKDYWSQLAGVYVNLATLEKDENKAREYNTRAILAIERAQSLGFMKTPKDNYTLVGIYFNVGQFGRATELLHAGLRDGSIESEQKNWELLAYSYQQVDKPFQAIEALAEGTKHFPKSGQLDYQIATIYYSLNKPEDSFKYLQTATTKGNLDKPGSVYGFMAYVCWELGKYTEAQAAVEKALSYPESQKDTQLPKLKTAIAEAIRDREAAKANAKSL